MYHAHTELHRQSTRWLAAIGKSLLLCAALMSAPQGARAQEPEYVPGEVLVGFRQQTSERHALETLAPLGDSAGQEPVLHAHRLRLRQGVSVQDALTYLRQQPGVAYAEPNYLLHATATPNDPSFASQWALKKIQADQAWAAWQPKTAVIVAVVDTGIDGTHPDLRNKMLRDASGNILGYDATTSTPGAAADDNGHGTHCAGIIGAQIDNGLGVAGIAGWNGVASSSDTAATKLMPIKALDKTATGTSAAVSSGIRWAVDHGARVISMSFGSTSYSITIDGAVQYAASKGCVVVAAAGNNSSSARFYPAACANVISVAASDGSDTLASFSNYGSWVSVAAPGVNILSTTPTYASSWSLNYAYGAGTSMACPHVAGEAALLWAQNPSLSASQVSSLIEENVDPVYPYAGHTLGAGAGRINVLRAMEAAAALSGGPPAAPTNLKATANSSSVSLQWSASAGATSYNVKRATTSGGPYTVIASGLTTTSYVNSGLTNGTTYYYVVTAFNSNGSADSQEVSAKTHSSLASVTINPTSVQGGASATGTVTLDSAAPSGGASVTLSDNSAAASVPGSVTVAAGATSASFTISTSSVTANTTATITATYSGASKSAALTIQAPAPTLQGLSLSASSVQGGGSVTGTVTLSSAAPSGGASVTLSDNSAAASVPGSVTVAAGAT
ncbi:MAG TPA: S8 family serine peptidase, partial [Chthonomonadaceae bacterium]|nr:S8 family serine peptidase [Chthonomonadaceae bacterium]